MDRLYKRVIGLQKAGAPSLRNHAGSASSPVAVGCRRSSMWNTCHSLTAHLALQCHPIVCSSDTKLCSHLANVQRMHVVSVCQCQCQSKFFSVAKIAELLPSPQFTFIMATLYGCHGNVP